MAIELTQGVHNPLQQHWDAKYAGGPTPWDTRITPPEVHAFWQSGRLDPAQGALSALDLGCGPGTNSAFLARRGIRVLGIEISSIALSTARRRHLSAMHTGRLQFVQADVCKLPLAPTGVDYIGVDYMLDIGCLHGLAPGLRPAYAAGVINNLRPGGYFQLFAFDRTADSDDVRGLVDGELEQLFAPHITVLEALTARPDHRPCHWYILQRSA